MKIDNNWNTIRPVFEEAFKSCLHFSLATTNADGSPHVTPIGALILRDDQTGYFFDEYSKQTRENLSKNPRVCFMAVNADKFYWMKSLIGGKFGSPPAVRLMGTVKELRDATPDEIAAWRKHIAIARHTKGYEAIWGKMHTVRDVVFDSYEPVNIGTMTSSLWK